MDAQTQALIDDIRAFITRHGMKETTFGLLSVNDGKFVGRVASGGNVTLKTVSRVREFMETYSPTGGGEADAEREAGGVRSAREGVLRQAQDEDAA